MLFSWIFFDFAVLFQNLLFFVCLFRICCCVSKFAAIFLEFDIVFPNFPVYFWICCHASKFAARFLNLPLFFPNFLLCFQICCCPSEIAVMFENFLACFWIFCCFSEFAAAFLVFWFAVFGLLISFALMGHHKEDTYFS